MLRTHKIADNIYHINESLDVFITLIVGKNRALLIDTGFGVNDIRSHITSITQLPLTVVNTHGHIDHINGNFRFDKVYLHPNDIEVATEHSQASWKERVIRLYAMHHSRLPDGFNKEEYIHSGMGNVEPLSMGTIDLGGVEVVPVHTPGHSKGCVSYYVPSAKLVFTGDAANGNVFMFLPTSMDIATYISSLDKLNSLDIDAHVFAHYYAPVPRSRLMAYKECAQSIDVAKSRKRRSPLLPHLDPLIYTHKVKLEPSRYDDLPYAGHCDNRYASIYYDPTRVQDRIAT